MTALVDRHPFSFCCMIVLGYVFSSSCRCAVSWGALSL